MPEDNPEESFVYSVIRQFPHCDARVLHKPGDCKYCDEHPEWQALRILWGISFSGENNKDKYRCPSEVIRPAHVIAQWPGNQATVNPVRTDSKTIYELIREEDP